GLRRPVAQHNQRPVYHPWSARQRPCEILVLFKCRSANHETARAKNIWLPRASRQLPLPIARQRPVGDAMRFAKPQHHAFAPLSYFRPRQIDGAPRKHRKSIKIGPGVKTRKDVPQESRKTPQVTRLVD